MAKVSFYQLCKSNSFVETASTTERTNLLNNGWSEPASPTSNIYQNAADYSGSVALYRLQDPVSTGYYYTTDSTEKSTLIAAGWTDQGTAGYVVSPSASQPSGWGPLHWAQNTGNSCYIFTASATQWNGLGGTWMKSTKIACYVPDPRA